MKKVYRCGFAAALFFAQSPFVADAYVDVELQNGRHVIGESYKEEGAKVIVFRPLGNLEVDSASVRSVREISGAMPSDTQRTIDSGPAAATTSASVDSPMEAIARPASAPDERAKEITAKLFEVYRFRLAAKNRGDDAEFAKLDKEAKRLVEERAELAGKAKSEKPATKSD